MFSYVETTLRQIAYALDNNMIPVNDMRGVANTYVGDVETGSVNMWGLYFEQPLQTADYSSLGKVVDCSEANMSKVPYRGVSIYLNQSRWFWGKMYEKFFSLNGRSREYFEKERLELFGNDASRVLGVLLRGTDMIGAVGHNAQPKPQKVLETVKELISNGNLATETYANVILFRNELGDDRVLVNKRVYYDQEKFDNGMTINDISFDRENDKYLRGMEYLSSVMLLSECGGLIGGFCGGSVAAFYINNGEYKYNKLFDLGMNR